jgi:uncharacterized phiE125 gp8 family phage protein
MGTLLLQEAPAANTLPVSLAEAKLHLRVDAADEDTLITSLINAATQEAEHVMQRAIMPQKWRYIAAAFEDAVPLRRPLVTAVESVQYVDTAGATQTLAAPAWRLVEAGLHHELRPAVGGSWPAVRYQEDAVRVTFVAGWADAAAVPELIKAWIKLRLGALYEHRGAWSSGQPIHANEHINFLLDRWRVFTL